MPVNNNERLPGIHPHRGVNEIRPSHPVMDRAMPLAALTIILADNLAKKKRGE